MIEASSSSPAGRQRGKVCLVTGGGTGIGRAAALRFAAEGALAVVVSGRRADAAEAVAAELRSLGAQGVAIVADVTLETQVQSLVEQVVQRFGRIDVAFNNAGYQERRTPLADTADETYARVFDTNVRALLHCLRYEIRAMLAGGGGSIVNNTSVSGIRNPNPGLSLYSASKAAAVSLTRSAAMEYAPQGIRINAVAPGRVVTDMMLASGIADMSQVAAGCRCDGWGSRRRLRRRCLGCCPTMQGISSGMFFARMGVFWRGKMAGVLRRAIRLGERSSLTLRASATLG